MRKLGLAIVSLYALFCMGLMLIIPMNKFEWMLDEPNARTEGLTFCGLPLDTDISPRLLSWAFLAPILIFGIVQSVRHRKIHHSLWIALVLFVIWGWRFFIYYPVC